MGAYVKRNGKTYYKADDGKLYQDYNAALKTAKSRQEAQEKANRLLEAKVKEQSLRDRNPLASFNPVEAVLGAALNNPTARAIRGVARFAGDRLGAGTLVDAADNAIRAVTGDRAQVNPSTYSAQTRDELATAIDRAYARGAIPNAAGYVPVDYVDYSQGNSSIDKDAISKYVTGRMFARKTNDGRYEISPDERYDFNASQSSDQEAYKRNLDAALSDAIGRGDFKAALSSVPDYLNYYTGVGETGMSVGGMFERESSPAEVNIVEKTESSPQLRNRYVVRGGDTLSKIAADKGMSVRDLINLNKITNPDFIRPGQELIF